MFPIIDKKQTGINLRRIVEKRGITAKDVQQYLHLGCVQSVYRWFNGQSMPTIDNLYALSELLQVSIDTIVCGNRKSMKKHPMNFDCDSTKIRLFTYFKMFSA